MPRHRSIVPAIALTSALTRCHRQGQGAFGKVYKALRGGVQDVAVKQLHHTGDGQLEHFIEVSAARHHRHPAGFKFCRCADVAHIAWQQQDIQQAAVLLLYVYSTAIIQPWPSNSSLQCIGPWRCRRCPY